MSVSAHWHTRRTVVAGLGLGVLSTVAGCGGGPRVPDPIDTAIELRAADSINPNELGEASPVVVRVFELKDTTEFDQAQLFELLESPQDVLGANFIGFQEIVMRPGQTEGLTKTISGETRFLGIAAAFRDIDAADWRKSFELDDKKKNSIVISITAVSITVTKLQKRRLGLF